MPFGIDDAAMILGGASALNSIFGKSEEDIRAERKRKLLEQIANYRQQALRRADVLKSSGIKDIASTTQTQLGRAQSDVSRRMASLGRSGDVESALLPVTSNINESGGRTMENALKFYDTQKGNIESAYDEQSLGVESDFAGRPIEPSIADQLMNIGSQYLMYRQNQDYVDAYKNQTSTFGQPVSLNNNSDNSLSLQNNEYSFGGNDYSVNKWLDPKYLRKKYNIQDTSTWYNNG